jgi:dTDP-4-amino-4,6-dideoxygalactose transaminase
MLESANSETVKTSSPKTTMQVPMLDLSRQYAGIRSEVLAAVDLVCDSQRYILGDEVTAFEREFASLCGTQDSVGCASGTDALWLALAAAGIGPSHDVITTPFSFFATASSIVRAGARPVFVDVDEQTLNMDPAAVEARLKVKCSRRKGIMPVHLYGQCADMDALNRIANEYKLIMVEDAAQAVGATWNGRLAGSLSVAAAFSFYPTKNLSAFGDAGALTTSDATIAERSRLLRNHGGKQRYYHDEVGANSRLDSIQAAVLRVKMPHLPQWNEGRRERAAVYDRLLQAAGLTRTGAASPAPITPLATRPEAHHIYHQYVVRAGKRDKLRKFLGERGIGTEIYYPVPLHLQNCFAYLGYSPGDLPVAEKAAAEVLALPMFPELREDEQKYVVEGIAEFYS